MDQKLRISKIFLINVEKLHKLINYLLIAIVFTGERVYE